MRVIILAILFLLHGDLYSQIDMSDTSIYVMGSWSKYENKTYEVCKEHYSITNGDTTGYQTFKYEVLITVKDSTSSNYILEWRYRNLKNKNRSYRVNKRLQEMGKSVSLLLKTDDVGQFIEVINWQQVRDNMQIEVERAKKEFAKYPDAIMAFENLRYQYRNKSAIDSNAAKDVQQLLYFHGLQCKQKDDTATLALSADNLYPSRNEGKITLKELNAKEDFALLQYNQVNTSQVLYLRNGKQPKKENHVDNTIDDFNVLKKEKKITTKIQGNCGWIIDSTEAAYESFQNTTKVEIRKIKLK